MISFRFQEHSMRGAQVVEIISGDGDLLGVIYPQTWGIRLVSKYLSGDENDEQVKLNSIAPVTLEVRLP